MQMAKSIAMAEETGTSVEGIDTSMKSAGLMKSGPICTADLVGLDVLLETLTVSLIFCCHSFWCKERGHSHSTNHCYLKELNRRGPHNPTHVIPPSLITKVKVGKVGRKSGEGYYKWENPTSVKPVSLSPISPFLHKLESVAGDWNTVVDPKKPSNERVVIVHESPSTTRPRVLFMPRGFFDAKTANHLLQNMGYYKVFDLFYT